LKAGRAGRDGDSARCVILYAPEDLFRIACLAVGDVEHCPVTHRVRPKVFTMIRYCHSKLCRRISFQQSLESSHIFSENSNSTESATCLSKRSQTSQGINQGYELCDNCRRQFPPTSSSTSSSSNEDCEAIQLIFETIQGIIIRHEKSPTSRDNKSSLTLNKLMNTSEVKAIIKELKKNKSSLSSNLLPSSPPSPSSLYDWEYLIVTMIERNYLDLTVHFTPYSTICYIASGERNVSSGAISEYLKSFYLKLPSSQEITRVVPPRDDHEVRVKKRSKRRVVEEEDDDEMNNTEKGGESWIDLTIE
jgi:hypothetical protein